MITKEDWSHDRLIDILKSTKDLKIVKDNGKQILVKTLSAEPFFNLFKLYKSAFWAFTDPEKETRENYYKEYVREGCEQCILFNLEEEFVYDISKDYNYRDLACFAFTTVKGISCDERYPNICNGKHITHCFCRTNHSLLYNESWRNNVVNLIKRLGYWR